MDSSAVVIGRVRLGKNSSVWPGAVLRGDIESIGVGEESNIQDNAVLHTDRGAPTLVGKMVTVGHGAILHSCRVRDGALVGMGSVILNGAVVGLGAMVGAGSLVPPGMRIPDGHLALGSPARVTRPLTTGERRDILANARRYKARARVYSLEIRTDLNPA